MRQENFAEKLVQRANACKAERLTERHLELLENACIRALDSGRNGPLSLAEALALIGEIQEYRRG